MVIKSQEKGKIKTGLTDSQVKESYEKYGDNRLKARKNKKFILRYFENFNDPIIRVLLFSLLLHAIFSFGHIDWFETGGILIAILLSTTVSTLSEHSSENAFSKMQEGMGNKTCRVVRNSVLFEIPIDDLVRGDIVICSAGETVSADGIIVDGKVLVDQSALNGESEEVEKRPANLAYNPNLSQINLLFRGSILASGECKMEVARVGNDTQYGQIAQKVQEETRESPLRIRLKHLAKQISIIGYISAAVVALFYLFNCFVVKNNFQLNSIIQSFSTPQILFPALLHAFTLAITIIVVAVPEGLPMMIAVVLSANMKRMIKDNVFVKKMVGIETAGSMNMLFCDKTGTLTKGKMKVLNFILGDSSEFFPIKEHMSSLSHILSMSAFYNTESTIINGDPCGGNATDRAILNYFKGYPKIETQVLDHIPFSSESRFEAVCLDDNEKHTIIKGAPELLLQFCTQYVQRDGEISQLDKDTLIKLKQTWYKKARTGQRILAVCISDRWDKNIENQQNLVFVSFICLKDELRRDAKASVEKLQKAGIQVIMITGDNLETASAIASECGIYLFGSHQLAITGNELQNKTDDEIIELLPSLRIVARALPSDKSRLVQIAQRANYVVGMTGDGINDSPALKLADVGFSMGQGTDIAKEASDIILLDGSISSIVKTVLYGRTIFHSIRKFISFQLIMNFCAVGVSLLGQYIGIETPITIVQMLWVNVIMDTLGGLAFAGEPPIEYYLKEPPKRREEALINRSTLQQIAYNGGFVLIICALFLAFPYFQHCFSYDTHPIAYLTAFFVLFIFLGVFTCFNVRTERLNPLSHLAHNKGFILIMMLISCVQIIMVCIGGSVFRTVPLSFSTWCHVILLAFSIIPIEFIRKFTYKLSINH